MKPVKAEESLLACARAVLIDKLAPRLALNAGPGAGFADEAFVKRFGPGLHRLSDAAIVNAALGLLVEHVDRQPDGKCGLPLIDNAPAVTSAD